MLPRQRRTYYTNDDVTSWMLVVAALVVVVVLLTGIVQVVRYELVQAEQTAQFQLRGY